jgi:hypothetical protein
LQLPVQRPTRNARLNAAQQRLAKAAASPTLPVFEQLIE